MVITYEIKPGDRINEVVVADELKVSRTPLREALHRLVAENILIFVPNKGFYTRQLKRQEIFDLYELRGAIELAAVDLALRRATQDDLVSARNTWLAVMQQASIFSTYQLLEADEQFHLSIARLSGNQEIVNMLQTVNARIHYCRWSDLEGRKSSSMEQEHLALLDALLRRDGPLCRDIISRHVERRMEEITQFIQDSVVRIYADNI
ncbi:GntR family transcriptional regulator [Acidithiobacillus thiooxidans]|nr:GntR family transcriptional regulator [Acidithiobacillus thiooxidans]